MEGKIKKQLDKSITICKNLFMKKIPIEHQGSLITVMAVGNKPICLGYLMDFKERGIFEPTHGKVDVTPEEASKHNECLSEAEIKGLDENCQIGQMGMLYFDKNKQVVHTWIGTPVSDHVQLSTGGKRITFYRNGKQYRGLLRRESDDFIFKRIL